MSIQSAEQPDILYSYLELKNREEYLRSQLRALKYLPRPDWDERLIQIAHEIGTAATAPSQ